MYVKCVCVFDAMCYLGMAFLTWTMMVFSNWRSVPNTDDIKRKRGGSERR